MKKKNKKAQIGITLTWFTAFLIIFFIMLLFISFSSMLAIKKVAPRALGGEGGFSEIDIVTGTNNLIIQRELITILNTPTQDGKTIQDLIIEYTIPLVLKKEEIRKKTIKNINNILENKKDERCYYFVADSGNIVASLPPNARWISHRDDEYRKTDLNVFYNDKKINVEFSTAKC